MCELRKYRERRKGRSGVEESVEYFLIFSVYRKTELNVE